MKTECKPPKCAVVKEKCQCPNPWLEHLAHTAAERKAKGLKRMSIKQHAKDYKKAVRSGKYSARTSIKKVCKSNAKLLCDWNAARSGHSRDTDTAATGSTMSEQYPPGGWDRDLLTLESPKVKDFKQNHLYIADYKGRRLVFKEFEIESIFDKRRFLFRTQTHIEMHKRLGERVPRLYLAYFLNRNGGQYGIQIMECASGILLENFLPRLASPKVGHDLAMHLKEMFDALKKAKVWHGDLHEGNWIIDVTKNGSIKAITLIDFDYSVVDAPDLGDRNVLSFLESVVDKESSYLPLLPYLLEAGIKIPADILEWDTNDFEREYSHLANLSYTIVQKMSVDPDITLEVVCA